MPVITVRVDPETRDSMRRVKGVNWSEVVRQAIREEAERRMSENRIRALLTFQELSRKPPKGFDSTTVIRYWRDRRYGSMRGRR